MLIQKYIACKEKHFKYNLALCAVWRTMESRHRGQGKNFCARVLIFLALESWTEVRVTFAV